MACGPIPPKHAAENTPRLALDAPASLPRRRTVRESLAGERRAAQGERVVADALCAFSSCVCSTRCLKKPWSRRRCPNTMNVWSKGTRGAPRASDDPGGRSFSVSGDNHPRSVSLRTHRSSSCIYPPLTRRRASRGTYKYLIPRVVPHYNLIHHTRGSLPALDGPREVAGEKSLISNPKRISKAGPILIPVSYPAPTFVRLDLMIPVRTCRGSA